MPRSSENNLAGQNQRNHSTISDIKTRNTKYVFLSKKAKMCLEYLSRIIKHFNSVSD